MASFIIILFANLIFVASSSRSSYELYSNKSIESSSNNKTKTNSRNKRQIECRNDLELDEDVYVLSRLTSNYIRAKEPFIDEMPDITKELKDYNTIIFLHSGSVSRAYTISLKKTDWVLCTKESISIKLNANFEQLIIMYKFKVFQNFNLVYDGDLIAKISHPKVQVEFTETCDEYSNVKHQINSLQVISFGHVDIKMNGNGNLTLIVPVPIFGKIRVPLDDLNEVSQLLTNSINENSHQILNIPDIRQVENLAINMINNELEKLHFQLLLT